MYQNVIIEDDQIFIDKNQINLIEYIEINSQKIKKSFILNIEKISKNKILKDKYKFNKYFISDFFSCFEKNPYHPEFILTVKVLAVEEILKNIKKFNLVNNIKNKTLRNSINIIYKNKFIKPKYFFFYKIIIIGKAIIFYLLKLRKKKIIGDYKNIIFTYNVINKENDDVPAHWFKFKNLKSDIKKTILFVCFPIDKSLEKKNFINANIINIESIISNQIILKSLFQYVFLCFKNFLYKPLDFKKKTHISILNIFNQKFIDDLIGINLLTNIIYINFFHSFFNNNYRNKIYYVFENYSWQRIIEKTAQVNKHKNIFAFQHSSVRYWDTRYFASSNYFLPKNLLVCSKSYYSFLNENSLSNVQKIENLRLEILPQSSSGIVNLNSILIFLDHIFEDNKTLMDIFMLNPFFFRNFKFYIKNKHFCKLMKNYLIDFEYTLIDSDEIKYKNFNFFIVVGSSGVVEDLSISNIMPFVYLPKNKINLSPFKNIVDKVFFSNYEDLFHLISNKKTPIKRIPSNFYLGDKLELWNDILINESHS